MMSHATFRQLEVFEAIARLDGAIDVEYYRGGGILPTVLRRVARED